MLNRNASNVKVRTQKYITLLFKPVEYIEKDFSVVR